MGVNLVIGVIAGIISGILSAFILNIVRKNKKVKHVKKISESVIYLTFLQLENYHQLKSMFNNFLVVTDDSFGEKSKEKIGPLLSRIKGVFLPYMENFESSLEASRLLLDVINQDISETSDSKRVADFWFNENLILLHYESLSNSATKLYKDEVSRLSNEVTDHFKSRPLELIMELKLINAKMNDFINKLENRISQLSSMINYGFTINRMIHHCIWQNAQGISYKQLLTNIGSKFVISFDEIEFRKELENMVSKKQIYLNNELYSKNGYVGVGYGYGKKKMGGH